MQAAINDHRNHLRFTFAASAAADIDTFSVIDLEGYEAIGRPFSFTLTLAVTRDRKIDPEQMLSASATLTIRMPAGAAENAGKPIPYHGVLAAFDELEKIGDLAFYRAVLTPRFARASLNRISDVYLKQQSIAATLADVLADNVFPDRNNGFQFALKNQYEARDSICQYQESTFDFISRWMEKEGMYYYFEHGDVDKMMIVDDTIKLPDSLMRLHYRPAGQHSTDPVDQAVQTFICRRAPLPKQVILQDFNHRAATAPLRVLHDIPGGGIHNGDVMFYGEDFRTQEQGLRYARLRAEEIACGGVRYCGSSTAVGLRCGHFMDLIDSPLRPDASGKFLITEIEHRGSQAGLLLSGVKHPYEQDGGEIFYSNNFTAIPGGMQFRAARSTPRPTIAGAMSAVIDADGKSKYANLDEQGQYHVQMPFIRQDQNQDKNSPTPALAAGPKPANQGSARIRMATPYAGSNHGMDFPLHQGAEVLLTFINGDPDQPVIMNAVPNSANPSIVDNAAPQLSRIVSAGGNKITINDAAGSESIELKAPNGNGTAMIGGSSGNAFFSKSNTNLVTLGAYNKVAVGPNNTVSASTDTTFSISLASKIAMGASMTYTLGSDIKWNSSWSETTTLDEGTSYALKEVNRMQSGKEIDMSAGYNPEDAAALAELDTLKTRIKLGIAAVTAINLATGVGAMVLTETMDDVKSGKSNLRSPQDIAAFAGHAGVTAITTAAGVGILHTLIRSLVKKYAALTCASKMLLNKSGISQTFNPTPEITRVSQLKFDGITHAAYSKDEAGDVVCAHRLSLGDKGSQLLAGSTIGGAEASLILEAAGTGVLMASGKLDIAATELVIRDKGGAAIAAQDGALNIAAGKIVMGFASPAPMKFSAMQSDAATDTSLVRMHEIGRNPTPVPDPFHGFSVADAAVQMQFKNSGVKATADSLTLAFGGSGVTLSAAGATMRGDMIRIG